MVVAWEPPEFDGGMELTGYQVEKSLSGGVFVNTGFVTKHKNLLSYSMLFMAMQIQHPTVTYGNLVTPCFTPCSNKIIEKKYIK